MARIGILAGSVDRHRRFGTDQIFPGEPGHSRVEFKFVGVGRRYSFGANDGGELKLLIAGFSLYRQILFRLTLILR